MEVLTMQKKLDEMETIMTAMDDILQKLAVFDTVSSEEELDDILPGLLASMGRYSQSDRAYLFTWTDTGRQVLRMTHEWCAEGIAPTIGEMQHLAMVDMPNWAPRLLAGESIVSMDWDAEKVTSPEEFALFDGQDIHSLLVLPIFTSNILNGYIGFDNPEQSKSAFSLRLLSSVGGHIGGLRENLAMMKRLEEKQHSLQESLREQQQQKVQLEEALAVANLNSEIVGAISKIYWLIYRMDLVEGTYEEISAGSEVHRLTGKHGITVDVFKEVRENVVAEAYQETMKRFLDTSTLADRLQDTESVAAEYQSRSGSWHLGRFIVKKRNDSGRVTNVLYVVRKIDKQKQMELEYRKQLLETAEDARRANMAKTDFLRRMSHDIRTPINGIQGMVAIAEHFPDDLQKQKECRDKVKEASGFLLDLVNSILDMNKLESGAVVLAHEAFDLEAVLKEANSITEMNGAMKGLTITTDHTKVRHFHLIGSAIHLKQILQNIAGNAVKYNHEGGAVHLSTEEIDCGEKEVTYRFICADTGRGMSEEFLKHAFEPFTQEDASARTSYMGTGLGLSITKQLVEKMGGTIRVESGLNEGTTVTICLSFDVDTDYEKEHQKDTAVDGGNLSGTTVLLTEDNELNMEIAAFILENAGMQVIKAKNGQEAVDLFAASEEGTFDVILMDVMMPVMDGLTAAEKIRAMDRTDAGSVPIFAMTANAFAEDIARSKEAGMNEHLSKPLDEQKILDTIRKYVTV